MLFQVEGVLFDIDGTLVDSTEVVERVWRKWAAYRGLDAGAIIAVCHGRRTEDTLAEFLPPDQIQPALAELLQMETEFLDDSVVAVPGAKELLDGLSPQRWAAVTSGSVDVMRARLVISGLPIPDVLITAEDVTAGKPDPQGYLKAAAGLGLDPRRCLVVEDAPAGIAAGKAAGSAVVALTTTHSADRLSDADAIVADLSACSVTATASGLLFSVGL